MGQNRSDLHLNRPNASALRVLNGRPECSTHPFSPLIEFGTHVQRGPGKLRQVSNEGYSLLEGLYESLITRAFEQRLAGLSNLDVQGGVVDEADEPDILARYVHDVALRAMRQERDAGLGWRWSTES